MLQSPALHSVLFALLLVKLDDAGFVLWAVIKYVGDVNVVCDTVEPGWRWKDGVLQWHEKLSRLDKEGVLSPEMLTMNLIREAAGSIVPWLEFMQDLPEMHESGKVPMLDLEVWVDRCQDKESPRGDILTWDFYEKSSSSSRVLQSTSAYEWRSKLVVMNMEMFRRHRNTSRQVSIDRRMQIMNDFVAKLRSSGYGMTTVDNIVKEGSRFYYRKLQTDLEGGPPLNQRSEENLVMERRAKLGAAETWYTRKRGGVRHTLNKDHGWRSGGLGGSMRGTPVEKICSRGPDPPSRRRRMRKQQPQEEPDVTSDIPTELPPEATIKVPYTLGSVLKNKIQTAENEYARMMSCRRVRVIECGGD